MSLKQYVKYLLRSVLSLITRNTKMVNKKTCRMRSANHDFICQRTVISKDQASLAMLKSLVIN